MFPLSTDSEFLRPRHVIFCSATSSQFSILLMFCESDAKSYGCDIFPVHLCHVLQCHHCICVHFRRALESQAKRCLHIIITSGCTCCPLRTLSTGSQHTYQTSSCPSTVQVFAIRRTHCGDDLTFARGSCWSNTPFL